MSERYYKVDLHVHTPASKCFSGGKSDSDYLDILRRACDVGLDIIAITDHNSIAGFERLQLIRKQLETKIEVLESIESNEDILRQLRLFKNDYNLFSKVKILPGVEVTVNPGVHIILITKEEGVSDLDLLLDCFGYNQLCRGDEESVPNIDIKELLEMQQLSDMIVIAPHVDSDKGIYNVLKGSYRAHIFKSDHLLGISCNNPEQLRKIKSNLLTQPDYFRNSPLGFINSSDAHSADEVGGEVSYVRMEDLSFEKLREAFNNPEQSISDTSDPELITIVRNILEGGKSIILDEKEINELPKAICACLNCSYSSLLLGVSKETHNIVGIRKTPDEMKQTIKDAFDMLSSSQKSVEMKMRTEILGNGRSILIVTFSNKSSNIWSYLPEQTVYLIQDNLTYKKATILEIEDLIRTKLIRALKHIDDRNKANLEKSTMLIESCKNQISKYEACNRVVQICHGLGQFIEVTPIKADALNDEKWDSAFDGLGDTSGNVFHVDSVEPRLDKSYLRYSCPSFNITDPDMLSQLRKFNGSAILISNKGGCYLVQKDEWYLYACDPVLIITLKKRELSYYGIIGWLKSTILLWYLLWEYETVNIYRPRIFHSLLVPNDNTVYNEIENIVENILGEESSFINRVSEIIDDDVLLSEIQDFNDFILPYVRKIDSTFAALFNLSDVDMQCFESDLKAQGVFCYN